MTTYRARPREPMAARRSLPQSRNLSTLSGPESRAAGFRYRPDPAVQPRVSCRRRDSPDGRSLASYGRRPRRERIGDGGRAAGGDAGRVASPRTRSSVRRCCGRVLGDNALIWCGRAASDPTTILAGGSRQVLLARRLAGVYRSSALFVGVVSRRIGSAWQ